MRQQVVSESRDVGLSFHKRPGQPDARVAGCSFLRCLRVQRSSAAVELLPLQPSGTSPGLHAGRPSADGRPAEGKEEQVAHLPALADALLYPFGRASLIQGIRKSFHFVNATRSHWRCVVYLNRNRILMPRPSISIKFARSKSDGRVVASQRRLRFSPATRRTSSKPKTARTPRSGSNVCRSPWRRHTPATVLRGPFRSISLWLNRNSDCGRPSDPDALLRLPSPKIRKAFCHIPFRLTLFSIQIINFYNYCYSAEFDV